MFEWLPRRATPAELAVARAILEGADRRAVVLLEQFRASRRVERRVEGASMSVTVPWTTEELMVDLDVDVTSDPVRVRDRRSGQMLQFRVHLARGGFFRSLEGRADARWPRRWEVDPDELAEAASGALRLPGEAPSAALAEWLGITILDRPGVVARGPATANAIDALQEREGRALPGQLREFLEVTDGLLVGGWAISGVQDLYVVELESGSYWQIAVGAGSGNDRRCLFGSEGAFVIVPSYDSRPGDFEPVGTNLREWVAGLVVSSEDRPK